MVIPESGIPENPVASHGIINPGKAIHDAKLLFAVIKTYRSRHGGQLPSNAGALVADMVEHFNEYGFATFQNASRAFSNPDSRYADNPAARARYREYFPFIINDTRPDGSKVGSINDSGKKDVHAYTSIYYHLNLRHFAGDRTSINPTGFFIILWDNGMVQKIQYKRILYVRHGINYYYAFPGQAGVPVGAMTYAQYAEKSLGYKKPSSSKHDE
jgi:hypothetical protein